MKLSQLRKSFKVYVFDRDQERGATVVGHVEALGYQVKFFDDQFSLLKKLPQEPPHVLLFFDEGVLERAQYLCESVVEVVPETHLIGLCETQNAQELASLYQCGLYDLLLWPLPHPLMLAKALDRAIECDYYMYMNEQLHAQVQEAPASLQNSSHEHKGNENAAAAALNMDAFRSLLEKRNTKDALDLFMSLLVSRRFGSACLFLRYVAHYQSLVASQAVGMDFTHLRRLGLSLSELESEFVAERLLEPMALASLQDMIQQTFGVKKYWSFPFVNDFGIQGVFVLLDGEKWNHEQSLELQALRRVSERCELEKRLHSVNISDAATGVLGRDATLKKLDEEIARSRRLTLPVSLILFRVDPQMPGAFEKSTQDRDTLLRTIMGLVKKHSRKYDIAGRTGDNQFALILPHTSSRGATVKAERLRRMIEAADFSRVAPICPRVSLSLGVCEYPSHCQDSQDILHMADESLFQVAEAGLNKVCVATAPDGFEPDFVATQL